MTGLIYFIAITWVFLGYLNDEKILGCKPNHILQWIYRRYANEFKQICHIEGDSVVAEYKPLSILIFILTANILCNLFRLLYIFFLLYFIVCIYL